MRLLNLACLMLGHDDRIRRVDGRMYLECAKCDRETNGWSVATDAERPGSRPMPAPSWAHSVRDMSQLRWAGEPELMKANLHEPLVRNMRKVEAEVSNARLSA
jgi:hypothetical protein